MAKIKIGKITLDLANTPAGHQQLLTATGVSAKEMAALLGESSMIGTIADGLLAFAADAPQRDATIRALASITGTEEMMPIIAQLRAFLADAAQAPQPAPNKETTK